MMSVVGRTPLARFGRNFSVSSTVRGDEQQTRTTTLAFVGELDFSLASEVRDALDAAMPPVRIDLAKVRYIDARIFGELVRCAKRIAPERLVLFGLQPQVRRVAELLQLEQIFTIVR
jgi:anti-anti-sigma factor